MENNERILDIVENELPVYPQPTDDYIYKMGIVRYPPWTIQCRQSKEFNIAEASLRYELE